MSKIENAFKWCLKKSSEQRGLKKIKSDTEKSKHHIKKAEHNLQAVDYNIKGGFKDWAVSAAFYAMYQALLAALVAFGYESKNQECTITAVEYFIEKKMLKLDQKYIEMVRRTSKMVPDDAKMLGEEYQYGTETEVDTELLNLLKTNAKEFVEKMRVALEEINPISR